MRSNHQSKHYCFQYCQQNCEFYNFFYELNSLIKLPISLKPNNVQSTMKWDVPYFIILDNNIFKNFSTCGSLLSNHFGYFSGSAYLIKPKNEALFKPQLLFTALDQLYWYVHILQDVARALSFSRHAHYATAAHPVSDQFFLSQIEVTNNVFSELTYLKEVVHSAAENSEVWLSRSQGYFPKVFNSQLRDRGLIIEINGNFSGTVIIKGNQVDSIDQQIELLKDGLKSHCNILFQERNSTFPEQSTIVGDERLEYFQYTHLISIKNVQVFGFLVQGNTFSNLSLTGPIIYFDGLEQTQYQILVIKDNYFSYLHTYANTGVLYLIRHFDKQKFYDASQSMYSFDATLTQMGLSGNIHIEGNHFSEIVGCAPYVHTSVFYIAIKIKDVNDINPYIFKEGGRRNMIQTVEQQQTNQYEVGYAEKVNQWWDQNLQYSILLDINNQVLITGINPLYLVLRNNQYINISIGTSENINNEQIVKGSLFKFVNIIGIDFNGELFQNIGAFTQEHLNLVF